MNRLVFSLSLAIMTIVATAVSLTSPAQAQTAAPATSPLADFQTQSDPFSGRGNDGSNTGIMNLLQQAVLGPLPDARAFAATNRELVQDAATAFRAKQQRLLQQRSVQPTSPQGMNNILLPGTLNPIATPGTLILTPSISPVLPVAPVTP
jgi:hypothetical protein